MIDPEVAWASLLPHLTPLAAERQARREAAGRRLAAPTVATTDLPPCDLSALDGFALAGTGTEEGWFPIAGTRFAGDPDTLALPQGMAMRIMTGSAVPAGADRVVAVEETVSAAERVRPSTEIAPAPPSAAKARSCAAARSSCRRARCSLPPRLRFWPARASPRSRRDRAPRLALQLTGNEIVLPDETPGAGQLRDSHSDFLVAELDRLNLPVCTLGIARDDPESLAASLAAGLEGRDVVLCCGGVSMGEADFLAPVLAGLGCRTIFHGVAIQPGKPLLVAHRGAQLIFGLPGNPASVMVAWWLFVRPALERLLGSPASFWEGALPGTLGGSLGAGRGRDRFVPAVWRHQAGEPVIEPISPKGSHDLLAFGRATALVRIRARAPAAVAGAVCEWLRLDV